MSATRPATSSASCPPGGFERFFLEFARKGGAMTEAEIAALNAELGIIDGGLAGDLRRR